MKRILSLGLCLSLVLILLTAFALPCLAAEGDGLSGNPLVVDNAGLLTPAERDALESRARSLAETYGCEVVILTVNGTDGKSAQDYADDFFVYSDYGYGEDRSGILFFMDMNERDTWFTTRGAAIKAFTDDDIDYIADQMRGNLSAGNYYAAFETYLDYSDKILGAADNSLSQSEYEALNGEYNAYMNGGSSDDEPVLDSGSYTHNLLLIFFAVIILLNLVF